MNNLLPGKLIFEPLKDKRTIVLAANIQVPLSAQGIMRAVKEKNAAVIFECAKSEHEYTGRTPKEFVKAITASAEETGFALPYAIHADHITVKGKTPYETKAAEVEARDLIKAQLKAGFTSFAIDASYLFNVNGKTTLEQLGKNIEVTARLAKLIPDEFSLEVEVGEIGKIDPSTGKPEITTVDEAVTFIKSLNERDAFPILLATNNGTSHGHTYDSKGNIIEKLGIDFERTKAIADAIKPFGVSITQHGITGTPLHLMHRLIDAGIRKGNVATLWRDIAMENFPSELKKKIEDWTLSSDYVEDYRKKNPNASREEVLGKNIKYSLKVFKKEIESVGGIYRERIVDLTRKAALEILDAFNAEGTVRFIKIQKV